MRLYLDDNMANSVLIGLLRKAGHGVEGPADAGLAGDSDARHFEHAIRAGLVLLTADRVDFWDLHAVVVAAGGTHPGILVVRYENDPRRDMKPKHVAAAVTRLERSGTAVASQVVILNPWR
jgi:hypothetical protein